MRNETIEELKQAMGYKEDSDCCSLCKYFEKENGSPMMGSPQPKYHNNQCIFNAIPVPVSPEGRCAKFKEWKLSAGFVDVKEEEG